MNRYKWFATIMIIFEIILLLIGNILYFYKYSNSMDRLYRVEATRVISELNEKDIDAIDLNQYDTIISIKKFDIHDRCNNDYVVEEVNGDLYRIEYRFKNDDILLIYMNLMMLLIILSTSIILIYIQKRILKPFQNMSYLTYELAKGNLSMPIKEEKGKLFGHFLWGMDMLREKLESDKQKELELQKEKKTLILSLSHDIKTPLSAIDLYTKALSSNLYDSNEKKEEAFKGISRNIEEIKRYVDEITNASKEDFLNLEVNLNEFYLSEIVDILIRYYNDKLSNLHISLIVKEHDDCLLKGDQDRLIEVLQNIMENAIKYGDGKEIVMSFEDEEDCKLIHIENSGNSLKEEELPNIYDSFYRGSNAQNIKGNGLGLYICKSLMKRMDGDIFAKVIGERFCMSVVIRKG